MIFGTFLAHLLETFLYALAMYTLVRYLHLGTLGSASRFSINAALYFSAETYTLLGNGDVVPGGDLRLLAGVEALNVLLLIGWPASYTFIAMERFWVDGGGGRKCAVRNAADEDRWAALNRGPDWISCQSSRGGEAE